MGPFIPVHLYSPSVLHADVEGTIFPLVFSLLHNKTSATYRRLFSLFRTAVSERQSALTPETWMIDFEVTARNAVGGIFPNTTIRGCFFHYTQCIWRKVQNCGLTTEFRENEEFHRLVRRAAVRLRFPVTVWKMCGSRPWRIVMTRPLL